MTSTGLQEPLGRPEGGYIVPKRFDQVPERLSDKIIVIDNANHWVSPNFTIPIR